MTAQNEGYKIMPPMDPKYTERSGLEGPFTTLSGKVVYYDPKEGKYYDPDTDMYMSYDEFQNYDKDYSGMGEGHSPHKKGSAKYKAHMAAKHASMNEGEEKPYICVHAKKGKHECRAESSYGAAKKAAAHWGMKSTAGIDAYLADVKHVAETLSPEDKALVNKMYNKDGTLTALGKRVMGTKESRTLENLMAKVFGKTVNEFKNPTTEAEVQVDEAGGYYTQPVYDMIEKHGYEKVMSELLSKLDADVIQDFLNRAELDENTYDTKDFEFNPRAGHRDQMSHPENRGLGAEPNRSYSPRPKLRPKNLKAPMTSPRPKARPKDLEMKYAINKAVRQAVGEGDSPHKKGTKKYKAHMAAKHASMAESTSKPEVSVTEMQDALKLKDAPSNEHVVASYVRTMIDESHKTWDDVMEQVEFVLDLVKEGNTMKAEDVFNIVKSQHMQNYFDYKMSLKENLDTLRNIVKDKSYQTVKFEDGSMKVDLTTANMFLQVFDAQKPETQEKIQAKIKTKQGFLAMLDLIYSKM